ncbi:MAG TPA: DUF2158 domain-containing protein [Terracidiphilus sp.]|jgi:uncharacterized protein YodC (DUF2158 family)|nr:DUF2158 domain-containing protein [Terracidiphilus sp.]
MADQFKVGDIVQLKSGGPPMTVKSVEVLNGECLCEWFGGGNTLKSHKFFPETLKIEVADLRGMRAVRAALYGESSE